MKTAFSDSLNEIERVVPQPIVDFLRNNQNVMLVFERNPDTDKIQVGVRKIYRSEAHELLKEARLESLEKKQLKGYTREDAIKDFNEAQQEIAAYLNKANE